MSTNQRLPKAIRQQVEQAAAIEATWQTPQAPEPAVEQTPAPEVEQVAPVETQPTEAVQQTPVSPPAPPQVDWEHRFKTLNGIYKQEVARAVNEQTQQATQRMQQLEEELKALRESKTQQPAVADPKDVEQFGIDLVEMVRRNADVAIKNAVDQAMGSLNGRLAKLEGMLTGTSEAVVQNAEALFTTKLTALVPNWEAINQSQEWLNWLGEVDPVYGLPRQAALDNAANAKSAERVAAIFKSFLATITPPAKKAQQRNSELESQVAPAKSGSMEVSTQTQVAYITEKDIKQFYEDVRRGRYRGREVDQAKREAEIDQAIAAGHIRA